MSYTTADKVRTITGLTESDITDSEINDVISIADNIINNEADVTLDTTLKELASTYLSASIIMQRLSSQIATSSVAEFSLGGLKVSKKSMIQLRDYLSNQFFKMYQKIVNLGLDGTSVRKIDTD